MQKNKTKDIIIVGFALFAIFFGAGNLIFPPYLGVMAGDGWKAAVGGFLLTDPIFPVIGVIATAMVGGMADDLGKRISHKFSVLIGTVSILTIGPFFAVPRTAATTHEVFTTQIFGDDVARWVTSVVFFAITMVLVINPTKVIDIIGKFLTPILILILVGTIIVAIFNPAGEIVSSPGEKFGLVDNLFTKGFTEGYQTMDALGAALMSGIVVTDLINKGYTEKEEQFKVACGVGIVAAILLAIVYGGFTFVGATVSDQFDAELLADDRTAILVGVFDKMFGTVGKWAIGIAVAVACLTTSIGLTGTAGNFFSRIFKRENDTNFYRAVVSVCVLIAFTLSLFGVTKLVFFAVPILSAIYPIYMILFLVTLFDKWIKYNWTYTGAVLAVAIVSIPMGIYQFLGMNEIEAPTFLAKYAELLDKIPLASLGFNWLIPAIVGITIFTLFSAVTNIGKTREDMIG